MLKALSLRSRLTLLACLLACVVVALGAFTRLADAGLGCPDWPGCYGQLLWPQTSNEIQSAEVLYPDAPVDTDKTWPEMVHRYFAGALGLVILGLAILSHKLPTPSLREEDNSQSRNPYKLAWALVLLVFIQALFGMWTVTLKLWPQVVTAHLLGGFTTLALLWLMFLRLYQRDKKLPKVLVPNKVLRRLKVVAGIAVIVVVSQIALGGWTSSNYAALACIDFPTCHGEWLPAADFSQGFNLTQTIGPNYLGGLMDNQARTAIHLTHRAGAIVVSVVVLLLAVLLWTTQHRRLRALACISAVVLFCQVILGVTNILAALPLVVAVLHNGVGALLLLVMVTVNYQLYRCAQYTALADTGQQTIQPSGLPS